MFVIASWIYPEQHKAKLLAMIRYLLVDGNGTLYACSFLKVAQVPGYGCGQAQVIENGWSQLSANRSD